jgi:beta-N-acetylhexosaminidase
MNAPVTSDALAVLQPSFTGPELPEWFAGLLAEGLGGVCLFGFNVESREQLARLAHAIHEVAPRAVIAIDEEGGDVTRLYQATSAPFPGNAVLGRIDDLALTRAVAEHVGWELRAAGVDLTLAPDVDVNSNPLNPVIGFRSFGDEPALVSRHGAAWVKGVQSTGVAACAKHFPGHGDTAQDSHLALPVVDADADTVRARDIAPFAAAIAAGVRTIMTSHIVVPALDSVPATFSHAILHGILRESLGFDGVIVTDALDMAGASGDRGIPAAAVDALVAGADFLCIGPDNLDAQVREIAAAIDAAVASGKLPADRLAQAAARVRELGAQSATARSTLAVPETYVPGAVPGLSLDQVVGAFDVSDAAKAAVEDARGRVAWLRLEPVQNIAVGASPWGPFAAGIEAAATLRPGGDVEKWLGAAATDALTVVVGKDNHRHEFARAAIDAARAQGRVVVVDMGWPSPDREYADIATFGASRLVGEALIARMDP